jgi:biopolymer transport protein ExbB/TolQ
MSLIQKFNEGGIFMYFILIFGIFSMGLIVERYLALYKKLADPSASFRKQLFGFIAQGDLNGAANFSATASETALGRISKVGVDLRSQGAGDEEVQARMDEALTQEISVVDQRTGFLAMFGNVATLLGLLGTITGMIHSFSAVASANPADRATMLSKGISEAMNCTAFGLVVAIPALVAFAVYQNRTDKFVNSLTSLTSEIFHDLLFFSDRVSTSVSKNSSSSRASASLTQ